MPPRGFKPSSISLERATQLYVIRLYHHTSIPEHPVNRNSPNHSRNREIVACYQNNETLESIASKFHISLQRVHQIIQRTLATHDDEQV